MVKKDQIIAILDLEVVGNSQITRNFFNNKKKKSKVLNISEEGKEKSFILSDTGCYLSPISSSTLLKRSMNNTEFA